MSTPASSSTPAAPSRATWWMLLALSTGFTLSQAFRTVAAIMGPPLALELSLSKEQLGLWAATFHFAFGLMQLAFGVSIDLWGVRRTILAAFPMAVVGALVSALAPSFTVLLMGQALIGVGCSPAFLVCTVFIARHFSGERFSATSGLVMSLSGVGVLLTATPLAALIGWSSWRWSYAALAVLAALAWATIYRQVRPAQDGPNAQNPGTERPRVAQAVSGLLQLFGQPHTWGLVAFAMVAYAGFITLRGLWLGPVLIERHGLTLLQSGNIALLMTLGSMLSPAVFGRLDPGGARRIHWLLIFSSVAALLLLLMAFAHVLWLDVAVPLVYGALSGYGLLQYGYVHAAYPAAVRGRALSLFTMAMFLGVALMQWLSGLAAHAFKSWGLDPLTGALLTMACMLLAGGLAFAKLPRAKSAL